MRGLALLFVALAGLFASPAFAQATYPTVAGSRVNGVVSLTCDATGANCAPTPGGQGAPTSDANAGIAQSSTPTAAASRVIKASPGNFYGYNVTSGASAGYILIYNALTAPADGTVTPVLSLPLAANTGVDTSYRTPEYFSVGIVIVFSTTGCFSQTASATAFISGNAK